MKIPFSKNHTNFFDCFLHYQLLTPYLVIEKLYIIVDCLQLYGIVWITSQPWRFPFLWIAWTRWTVVSNMDIFSLTNTGALYGQSSNINISPWGQMNNYIIHYCLVFSVLLLLSYIYFGYYLYRAGEYGTIKLSSRFAIFQYVLPLSYFMYIPQLLQLFRLFYCDSKTKNLAADPSISCLNSGFITYLVFNTLLHVPLAVFYPILLYKIQACTTVGFNRFNYEKHLQICEIAYMFNINNDWANKFIWVISPLNFCGRFYFVAMIAYKFLMLSAFIGFRFSFTYQASLMWFATFFFTLYYGYIWPPYRCLTSNTILSVCLTVIFINISFATANALNVQNAFLVSSVETMCLLSFHLVGVLLLICALLRYFFDPSMQPQVLKTVQIINNCPNYRAEFLMWIDFLRVGHSIKTNFLVADDVVADISSVEVRAECFSSCCCNLHIQVLMLFYNY